MAYSTRANVYALGLLPEAFARPPRRLEGVITSSGTLQLRAHGLAAGAALTLASISSSVLGAPAAALPAPIAEGVTYYALPLGSDTLQLATTPGGAAIAPFTTAGAGACGLLVDHGPDLDAAILAADTVIDAYAVAHKSPLQAAILPLVSAWLAARIYIASHAIGNPTIAQAAEPPPWIANMIDRLFSSWMRGAPLPAGSTDATPTVAENGAVLITLDGRGFLDACDDGRV